MSSFIVWTRSRPQKLPLTSTCQETPRGPFRIGRRDPEVRPSRSWCSAACGVLQHSDDVVRCVSGSCRRWRLCEPKCSSDGPAMPPRSGDVRDDGDRRWQPLLGDELFAAIGIAGRRALFVLAGDEARRRGDCHDRELHRADDTPEVFRRWSAAALPPLLECAGLPAVSMGGGKPPHSTAAASWPHSIGVLAGQLHGPRLVVRILVVDDEPAISRGLVARIAQRAGFDVDVARDGAGSHRQCSTTGGSR